MASQTSDNAAAAARAERQTDIHFDFQLEDIIAGNTPASEPGKAILAVVENAQVAPTQGKIETALLPLYEAMSAEHYRAEGGTGEPPPANRQSLKQHATKVIQARKVKRTAELRAKRPPKKRASFPLTAFQLGAIGCLVSAILLLVYLRS